MATEPWPAHEAGAETRTCSDERWRLMWGHREHLLKVARRRSMSQEDAEDAVHEAMLRAMENPRLDHDRLAAWLTTVTIRLCVDRYRQVDREAEVGSRTTFAAPVPTPVEDVVCDRDEASWLAERSGELPGRQAEALWLKSEDLDVAQVARRMGLSYRTVESLLARARRTLRNSLAGTLAFALWLCGRGRPRSGGAVQSAAVVSTAATLTVLGVAVPGVYDGTVPASPRQAAERAQEKRPVAYEQPAAEAGSVPVPGRGGVTDGTRSGAGDPLPPLALPALPSVPALGVAADAEVARVPELAYLLGLPGLPPGSAAAPSLPGLPSLPGVTETPGSAETAEVAEPVEEPGGRPGTPPPTTGEPDRDLADLRDLGPEPGPEPSGPGVPGGSGDGDADAPDGEPLPDAQVPALP